MKTIKRVQGDYSIENLEDPALIPAGDGTLNGTLFNTTIRTNLLTVDGDFLVSGSNPSLKIVSDTAPVSPLVGQEWLNTISMKTFTWYDDGSSAQWVE